MNKNYSCDIIKDLLPGYIDGVLSEASENVVKGHLEECEKCNRGYLEMKEELLELIEEDQKQMDDEEFRKYRDKVFRIAALGEEQGFVRGFRFAFQLFIECMNEKEP